MKKMPSFLKKMVMFLKNFPIFFENTPTFFEKFKVFLHHSVWAACFFQCARRHRSTHTVASACTYIRASLHVYMHRATRTYASAYIYIWEISHHIQFTISQCWLNKSKVFGKFQPYQKHFLNI